MNVIEPILFQVRFQPEAPTLCVPGRRPMNFQAFSLVLPQRGFGTLLASIGDGKIS
jgi:hypothetical protein